MSIILTALAVAFAACCLWLTVRVVNRRERWAKRMLVAVVIGTPVLYVLGIGPVAYITTRDLASQEVLQSIEEFYAPIDWLDENGPEPVRKAIRWYSYLWWHESVLKRVKNK